MSTRPGTPIPLIVAAAALAVAGGRNIPLNNQFAVMPGAFFTYVASATVGNRAVTIRLLDALSNILMQTVATTAITAGQTSRLILMSGQTYLNIASPISQVLPWPFDMPIPLNSSIQVLDATNVDVADTVAANITMAQ